jgi:hypothetical protein
MPWSAVFGIKVRYFFKFQIVPACQIFKYYIPTIKEFRSNFFFYKNFGDYWKNFGKIKFEFLKTTLILPKMAEQAF